MNLFFPPLHTIQSHAAAYRWQAERRREIRAHFPEWHQGGRVPVVADPSRGWSNVLVQCVSVGMQVRFCFCSTPFTLRAQVTIEVPFPKGTSARALAVAIGKTRISIGMKGQPPVLEGEFPSSEEAVQYTVKLSESTWYLGASLSFFYFVCNGCDWHAVCYYPYWVYCVVHLARSGDWCGHCHSFQVFAKRRVVASDCQRRP
jgi:hypothetical protein